MASSNLRSFPGFTEHAYRLVFEYGDKFAPAEPRLQTILPSGVVENDKMLAPKAEKGLIAYPYAQSIEPAAAAAHMTTPFVWKRDDGSLAVLQTWATNVNAKFRQEFEISTTNPDPRIFKPQAVVEFRKAVTQLFGSAVDHQPVLFCHRASTNTKPVFVGARATLLAHLAAHPEAVAALNIARLTPDGFVAATVDGKGEKGEKPFTLGGGIYALYVKQGWHTMACATPYEQFVEGRELHGAAAPSSPAPPAAQPKPARPATAPPRTAPESMGGGSPRRSRFLATQLEVSRKARRALGLGEDAAGAPEPAPRGGAAGGGAAGGGARVSGAAAGGGATAGGAYEALVLAVLRLTACEPFSEEGAEARCGGVAPSGPPAARPRSGRTARLAPPGRLCRRGCRAAHHGAYGAHGGAPSAHDGAHDARHGACCAHRGA